MSEPRIHRAFAMPSALTFEMPPVRELLDRWLGGHTRIVDPFCGNSTISLHRNDIRHRGGMDALDWLRDIRAQGVIASAVLLDPPYSPRQIREHYKAIGRTINIEDTQNARLYRLAREGLDALLEPGGIAISFGWSSTGFGERMGYGLRELLLVHHGGAHNDTIVLVEQKGLTGNAVTNDRSSALCDGQSLLSGGLRIEPPDAVIKPEAA